VATDRLNVSSQPCSQGDEIKERTVQNEIAKVFDQLILIYSLFVQILIFQRVNFSCPRVGQML